MLSWDDPEIYGGVDPKTLSPEERIRQWEAWSEAELARELAEDGPLKPGDLSEVKMRDVLGSAEARGMTDYRKVREAQAREAEAREAREAPRHKADVADEERP